MPVTITSEPGSIYVLRISGILKRAEFGENQNVMGREIDAGVKPRVLAILENFDGWEKGADWNDFDFLFSHSNQIARIAIVGDPRWEVQSLAFAGAGVRRAPVQFFPPDQLYQARLWLAQ
jgi:hypothetical protein